MVLQFPQYSLCGKTLSSWILCTLYVNVSFYWGNWRKNAESWFRCQMSHRFNLRSPIYRPTCILCSSVRDFTQLYKMCLTNQWRELCWDCKWSPLYQCDDVHAHISAPYLDKLWPVAAIKWPRPANILNCKVLQRQENKGAKVAHLIQKYLPRPKTSKY